MNLLFIFFFIPIIKNYHKIVNKIRYPIWHKSHIKCNTDDDCPMPFACCHDPFFPLHDKYCCSNYKNRSLKYAYLYNYIESNKQS